MKILGRALAVHLLLLFVGYQKEWKLWLYPLPSLEVFSLNVRAWHFEVLDKELLDVVKAVFHENHFLLVLHFLESMNWM